MENNQKVFTKFLLNEEEKILYFKLKLKTKLDKCYMSALRFYLYSIGINENLYSDDEILFCIIKGRKLCSK